MVHQFSGTERQHTFIKPILIPLTDQSTEISNRVNSTNLKENIT